MRQDDFEELILFSVIEIMSFETRGLVTVVTNRSSCNRSSWRPAVHASSKRGAQCKCHVAFSLSTAANELHFSIAA